MKDIELAYIAGLIDGEAHVGIQREVGRGRKTPAYCVRLEVAMTDQGPIDFMSKTVPGAKVVHVGAKGHRLPYFRIRFIHQEALKLLRDVLPYLQGKREEVALCLEIDALRKQYSPSRKHVGFAKMQPMPPEFSQQVEPLYWKLRSLHLNKKPRDKRAVERFI